VTTSCRLPSIVSSAIYCFGPQGACPQWSEPDFFDAIPTTRFLTKRSLAIVRYFARFARSTVPMPLTTSLSGKSVLDIGCADGFFCHLCARNGARSVLGVDSALGRLLRARFMALEEGVSITYRLDIFPSPRVREKYDYVLCLSVLHHSFTKKDAWKVLVQDEFADDLAALRQNLKALRALTAEQGRCVIEMPYEYDDPAERQQIDFQHFNTELTRAGFSRARCLGDWDHNAKYKERKDRIIYVAEG